MCAKRGREIDSRHAKRGDESKEQHAGDCDTSREREHRNIRHDVEPDGRVAVDDGKQEVASPHCRDQAERAGGHGEHDALCE